jgi:NitT/TauT family transport system ATP-binding protein
MIAVGATTKRRSQATIGSISSHAPRGGRVLRSAEADGVEGSLIACSVVKFKLKLKLKFKFLFTVNAGPSSIQHSEFIIQHFHFLAPPPRIPPPMQESTHVSSAKRNSDAPFAPCVSARGIRQVFDGAVVALDGIDLEVRSGEFLAILGPSGCGKSTLLRLIAGLDRPTAGTITVAHDGTAGGQRRADVAYVFQDAHLLPWRTVLRNVALPLELMGVPKEARTATSVRAIEQVGLRDAAARYPNQLSGGMRMRVSLARAMVTDPKLLLMDEPFAALDEITRQQLDEQLRSLWAAKGMTVVFVTHSTAEAAFLADRAIVMSPQPGRIVLDRRIELPAQRNGLLRGTPEFARETRFLFDALERGKPESNLT